MRRRRFASFRGRKRCGKTQTLPKAANSCGMVRNAARNGLTRVKPVEKSRPFDIIKAIKSVRRETRRRVRRNLWITVY